MTLATDQAGLLREILLHPEQDWLRLVYADLMEETGREEYAKALRGKIIEAPIWRLAGLPEELRPLVIPFFHLGFLTQISLKMDVFMAWAEVLFLAQPIARVVLVDRQPRRMIDGGEYSWYLRVNQGCLDPDDLPRPIWNFLPGARKGQMFGWNQPRVVERQALSNLELAAWRYGRHLAGLPLDFVGVPDRAWKGEV